MLKKLVPILLCLMIVSGCGVQESVINNNQDDEAVDFFIAVHLDPVMEDYEQGTTLRPERYWDSVVSLVETADQYDQKLTLMMNPQWGLYILENNNRLALVRSWEKNGHEIAVHYHGPEMGTKWSGYTNQKPYFDDTRFQGRTDDLMKIMTQIPELGIIKTATVNDADADYEFPEGVSYSTNGGIGGVDDLISEPEEINLNGEDVLQVLHAKYGEGSSDSVSLDDIKNAIEIVGMNEVIGIVFHDKAFENNPIPYIELFEYLDTINLQTRTISEILTRF